jgi:hypothetical protein
MLADLIDKGACAKQIALFKKLFGESVEVTEELCLKYYNKFAFWWAADNLLSVSAWEAYVKVRASAIEAYIKASTSAPEEGLEEYKKALALDFAQCCDI